MIANAYRLDHTLRRASAPATNCRVASSREKDEGAITGSMSTSPENGAGVVYAASVLRSDFTYQTGRLLWGSSTHAAHPPNE